MLDDNDNLDEKIKADIDALESTDNNESQPSDTQHSDFEQRVMKMGWNPKGTKTAEEWLYYGFEERGRKLSDLGKAVDSLKEITSKQEQIALEKARAEYRAEKRAAIERGDVETVEQLDRSSQQVEMYNQIQQAALRFKEKNSEWFDDTSTQAIKMQKACIELDNHLATKRLSPEKHFELLDKYMKDEFPTYFNKNDDSTKSSLVEGSPSSVVRTSSKKQYSFDDLNEIQKGIAKRLERTKVMTIKEYVEALVKTGDLK